MSLQTLAHQFVDLCNQGKNFDVMETMYAPDIVSVEGDGQKWTGKAAVIQKSRDWGQANTFHGEQARGPYFHGPSDADSGQFAVHFTLDVTRNATGERVKLEEVALYTVKDGQITREEFFYEGPH
jgi:hypothetical protein